MHRSPAGRSRGSGRRHIQEEVVDAKENPTELFQRIKNGDWDGASVCVNRAPSEASIWISRWSKRDNKVAWKYLPLHLVCLHQQPPWPLLQALIQANPQAASTPTQHDGNLPIHYVCESGCDDVNVFGALITAFPKCMLVLNMNNKTPMMLCHPRTRNRVKKLLKQLLPPELARQSIDASDQNTYTSDNQVRIDQRNGAESTTREPTSFQYHEQRQLPDDANKEYSIHHSPLQRATPQQKPTASFSYSVSSDDTETYSPSPALSRYFNSTQTRKDDTFIDTQQHGIRELTGNVKNLSIDKKTSDFMLSERILAKAESESVRLRAQVQQLLKDKEAIEEQLSMKESSMEQSLIDLTKALSDYGDKSRISLFQQSLEKQSIECVKDAVLALLSQMESKNETFAEEMKSAQIQLSEAEVKYKSALASNQLIQQEKQVIIKERDELEAMVTALEDERESLKNEVSHEKERSCSLKVINQMLQEQVNSAVGDLPGNEKNLRAQLRQMSAELLKMKEDQMNSVECKRYQDQITSLLEEQNTLRERNRILKETIRDNSEAYSTKIVELEKKFEAVEQSNEMLRLKTKYNDQIPEDEAKVEMLRLKAKYDPLEPEDETNI